MTLPPLPEKVQIDKHESGYVIWGYTADQMKAYAQAAQQARQPLTEDRIAEISVACAVVTPSDIYFARQIERAHGIGENT